MDEELGDTPLYLNYFDLSPTGFPWREPRPYEVIRRRADMNDKFIFDVLLTSGGIENPAGLFPPTNPEELETLLLAIHDSSYDTLKKECLVYLLLKWHEDGREERFKLDRCIPPQFAALADAYWHLDTGRDIARAVSILSDNRLNRDFASQILHAISISPDSSPLIIQYVRTAKPLLTEPQDVWKYTLALANSSLLEAWLFQRTFNETEELRNQLLSKILDWCILPSPRPHAISCLAGLPLSSFEEKYLYAYAMDPPKTLPHSAIAILRDLVCLRFIQSGRYSEAVKADYAFAGSTLNENKTDAAQRRKTVKELYESLPLAERTLLDAELEGRSYLAVARSESQTKKATGLRSNLVAADLSVSWDEIPRPPLVNSKFSATNASSRAFPTRHSPAIAPELGTSIGSFSPLPKKTAHLTPGSTIRPNIFTSRQSLPSTSLAASTSRLPALPNTPPLRSTPTTITQTFIPASRQPNAFYKPPPPRQSLGQSFSHESIRSHVSTSVSPERVLMFQNKDKEREHEDPAREVHGHEGGEREDNMVVAEDQQPTTPKKKEANAQPAARSDKPTRSPNAMDPDMDVQRELKFSIFGTTAAEPLPPRASQPRTHQQIQTPQHQKQQRRVPPGGLISPDESEDEDEVPPLAQVAPATRARTSTRSSQASQGTRANPKKRGRGRQSIPGTLVADSDSDEDHQDEDRDGLGSLPPPPQRSRARKPARLSTPMSDLGADEDASEVQTRRRSSRLSGASTSAGSAGVSPPAKKTRAVGAEKGEGKGAKKAGKKATRATTGATAKKSR